MPAPLCVRTCSRYRDDCPYAANEISTITDYSTGDEGTNCTDLARRDYKQSDFGNAQRLVDEYGEGIRFCYANKVWYEWNEMIWDKDTSGKIYQKAKTIITRILSTELPLIEDAAIQKRLFQFVLKSQNQGGIKAMVESATNEEGIPIDVNCFDTHKDYINLQNGIVDLRDGTLSPHNKELYITKLLHYDYNPDAACDKFIEFLNQIFDNNQELINFIQRFLGYSLTGYTSEQVFCIFYGHGSNGKGTLIDTIMDVMESYAKTTEPDTIIKKKYERSSTNDLADLKGARFVTTSENESYQEIDEGRIKRITGQDKLKCRFLYQEFFEYTPEFKLVLLTNHEPIIKAQDYSIWRRVLKVPFDVTIPKENWDLQLRDRLLSEKEGIFNWLVQGAIDWYRDGLQVPEIVKTATDEYKEDLDVVGDFIEMCTIQNEDKKVLNRDLYEVYQYWCDYTDNKSTVQNTLSRTLNERGFKSKKIDGLRYKQGLEINPILKESFYELKEWLGLNKNNKYDKTVSGSIGSIFDLFLKVPHEANTRKTLQKIGKIDPDILTDSGFDKIDRPRQRKCEKCGVEWPAVDLLSLPGIQNICPECIELIKKELDQHYKTGNLKFDYVTVIVNRDIGLFMGVDEKYYTLKNQDMVVIPEINARALIKRNVVKLINIGE